MDLPVLVLLEGLGALLCGVHQEKPRIWMGKGISPLTTKCCVVFWLVHLQVLLLQTSCGFDPRLY